MEIRFKIDPDRMTLGDRIALEEQQLDGKPIRWSELRDLLAHNMTAEDGQFLKYRKACELLSPLTDNQLAGVADKFWSAIQELNNSLVPPAPGGA